MGDFIRKNQTHAHELNAAMKKAVMPVTVFVGAEAIIAFFGNMLVIYVFLFRYTKSNFRYFVLCLAFIDITSSVTTMPGEMVTQLYWYVYPVPVYCKIKSFFNMFTVSSEALCLLLIAVDRYRKVCNPHGWQIRLHVAKWLCFAIYCTGVAISSPVPFFWGTHDDLKPGNITATVCEKDRRFKDSERPYQWSLTVEAILGICLVSMLLLYILVARTIIFHHNNNKINHSKPVAGELRTSKSIKSGNDEKSIETRTRGHSETEPSTSQESTRKSESENRKSARHQRRAFNPTVRRKTLIMFILTTTFIVTTILYLTLLSFITEGILPTLTDGQRAAYFFFFRLYFINHVINPIVYGVFDPQFRKAMISLKRRICKYS